MIKISCILKVNRQLYINKKKRERQKYSYYYCGSWNDLTSGLAMTIYFIKFLKDIIQFNPIQTKFTENRLWPRKLLAFTKRHTKYFEKDIYLVLLRFLRSKTEMYRQDCFTKQTKTEPEKY